MIASEAAGRLETASNAPTVGDASVAVFTNDVTPESVDRIAEFVSLRGRAGPGVHSRREEPPPLDV